MIASRSILACRETLAAGLVQRRAGFAPAPPEWAVDIDGLPPGVGVAVSEGHPSIIERLDPAPIDTLHAEAVGMAWRDGAWDIRVCCLPPLDGPELMLVGNVQCVDDGLREALLDAAGRGALIQWSWRPMRRGPALRRKAHQAKDRTLDEHGGRAGRPPEAALAIKWRWRIWRDRVIRLGQWSDAHRPAHRVHRRGPTARATEAQRAYIDDLRRRLGRSAEPLPATLTRGEASAIIDDLLQDRPR